MQTFTINATKNGPHKKIEFADFGVFKVWQFSKYNVRRDPIFEVETYGHASGQRGGRRYLSRH